MQYLYFLVYLIPGTASPVDTGLEFETLNACNAAAFEMATSDAYDELYSFQCLPRDTGVDTLKISLIDLGTLPLMNLKHKV